MVSLPERAFIEPISQKRLATNPELGGLWSRLGSIRLKRYPTVAVDVELRHNDRTLASDGGGRITPVVTLKDGTTFLITKSPGEARRHRNRKYSFPSSRFSEPPIDSFNQPQAAYIAMHMLGLEVTDRIRDDFGAPAELPPFNPRQKLTVLERQVRAQYLVRHTIWSFIKDKLRPIWNFEPLRFTVDDGVQEFEIDEPPKQTRSFLAERFAQAGMKLGVTGIAIESRADVTESIEQTSRLLEQRQAERERLQRLLDENDSGRAAEIHREFMAEQARRAARQDEFLREGDSLSVHDHRKRLWALMNPEAAAKEAAQTSE